MSKNLKKDLLKILTPNYESEGIKVTCRGCKKLIDDKEKHFCTYLNSSIDDECLDKKEECLGYD